MHWNEKIDLVKKKFPATDFKDPYLSGGGIVEKIVVKLFETTMLNFYKSEHKAKLLKNGIFIKTCTVQQLYKDELLYLNTGKNFWLLLMSVPMGSPLQVYDCTFEPMRELLYFSSGQLEQEFCIVDKKYSWLFFFKIDNSKNFVEIHKKVNLGLNAE